jgi:predicted DCC family thiol-disulfide oxidoreductase YuxK
MGMTSPQVTVYFDGACPVCSREIEHYRKKDAAGRLRLVDISHPSFDAAQEGVDAVKVQKVMHVRRADGSLATGVDAFIAIWDVLPGFYKLARTARRASVHFLLSGGYKVFSAIRPYLPKRQTGCQDGRCSV